MGALAWARVAAALIGLFGASVGVIAWMVTPDMRLGAGITILACVFVVLAAIVGPGKDDDNG